MLTSMPVAASPRKRSPHNRGPGAAPENRAALLVAARELFAAEGYLVPLNAIARRAGVGQGVLYRHFPTRLHIAHAVFAENFTELETLAASTPGADCFAEIFRRLIEISIECRAFVDVVLHSSDRSDAIADDNGEQRLLTLVAEPLRRAQEADLANPAWTPRDVLLMLHMVHGVLHTQPAEPTTVVAQALRLIDPRLACD